ncbi:SDR family NAD(P)-dependent oxidoreductase [Lederbergia citri]|uniref:SDR family NAD(P)-dependent oxidoreductase n=1 Tax=Lederbergia citri TaxID=2833580 RepID=UPI001F28C8B0|nr:SDR family NAD(P)-dependent oxidoreductase [Lederbergia citri]
MKTALITGASRGIGKGIALELAANGYDILFTYRTAKEEADKVVNMVQKEYGNKCIALYAELADEKTAMNLVQTSLDILGRLDVVINNAGVTIKSPLSEMDANDINHLLNLNLKAPLLIMKAVAKYMIREQIKGSIINIASTRGKRAYPDDAVYGATKAALIRATESVALECAHFGIRVNCIAPGATKVREGNEEHSKKLGGKIPLKRVGTPKDIGQAVAWLISEQASYITGETIKIDGGLILPGMPEDVRPEAGYGWGEMK